MSLLYVVWPSACVNRQYEEPTTFADVDTGDNTLDDTGGGTVRTHEIDTAIQRTQLAGRSSSQTSASGLGLCGPGLGKGAPSAYIHIWGLRLT